MRQEILATVKQVQAVPYAWPNPPDAASIARLGSGTCASKHALLAERLAALGIASAALVVVGPLVSGVLLDDLELAACADVVEVHECLTILTPWAGPLRVDITWDPPLVARGLPGIVDWDGERDMPTAIPTDGPGWAMPPGAQQAAKVALRKRLPNIHRREAALRRISALFAAWRA